MRNTDLVQLIQAVLPRVADREDELRDLDAALGDGDLGITVRSGAHAICAKLDTLPADAGFDEILRATGLAFAAANPSTFAALVGGALVSAAPTVTGATDFGHAEITAVSQAAVASIVKRGKAALGDKTVLDALIPSLDTLAQSLDDAPAATATAMLATARAQIAQTTGLRSARGRAAWLGDRSLGHADPGATAYAFLLQALAKYLDEKS